MFNAIKLFFKSNFYKISEINKRYSKPSIKITRPVRIALFCLRVYLLVLVGLLVYKFVTLL
ncbi:MAG: hypothetical protein PHC61_14165 [Chitinivibrionales bacterium]|nr:hypothetical protein [Chitinivibrionales bacterium]